MKIGINSLRVWHEEQLVGILSGTRDKVSFQYDFDWTRNGFALSLAMPLREESYGDEATRAYFSNLMPEEHILAMLCRSGKMAGHDLMSFFLLYGRECAGQSRFPRVKILHRKTGKKGM